MTTLSIYERGNTIKTSITYKSGSTLTDPSGSKAFVSIIKPDGTYLVGNSTSGTTASRDSTGNYHYYFTTSETDPLGIWTIEWECRESVGTEDSVNYGYPKMVQRSNIHIVNVDE